MTPKQYALALQMIDSSFRSLSKKLHPDIAGGEGVAMSELIDVKDILKKLVKADLVPASSVQVKTAPTEITMDPKRTVGGSK